MSDKITPEERALIASLKELPKIPVVIARDMYVAQTFKLSAEERANVNARKDIFRKLGCPDSLSLRVYDHNGAHIGYLTY